jgi:hypothetical protein
MQVKGQEAAQGEGLRDTYFKVNLGKPSHLLSMLSIGREKRLRLGCWK